MRIAFLGNFRVDYSSEAHHAKTLEALGHTVIRLQETVTRDDQIATVDADLFVWVHTHGWDTPGIDKAIDRLRARGITSLTYHLDLWLGLKRQQEMTGPYWGIDHFFTADRLMADWLNTNTSVSGHYLPAAVFEPECYIAEPVPALRFDGAIFVGSRRYHPEWQYRPKLLTFLTSAYGDRFRHYGQDGLGTVRGARLNALYSNTAVAVGDSLCLGYDYPDYWSDRVYETLGRGGFLIHPHVPGMEEHFTDGEHLVFYRYGDFDQLRSLIDHYLENPEDRERIRLAGHQHVKAGHTYTQRWETILKEIT